ncbi:MAG: serine/threonine-protein kinase, partial [Phycisphaeraceae bacterium]
MAFQAERLKQLDCCHCGGQVDVSTARPLSTTVCPLCLSELRVPAKVGSMLITGILGQGAGSIVYEATDRVLGRRVAVKVMKNRKPDDKPCSQSGVDEARSLLLISHPNVVKVHAIDTRQGEPCIIMELLPGDSLKQQVDKNQPLEEAKALRIALDVANGLMATNRRGLLHLDVKPGNIMFDSKGTAKLLDFGFAAFDLDTEPSEIVGTPYYVSPELVQQQVPDRRSDMYSLGATLYHLLTGQPPFTGKTIKKILSARLKRETPPDPRDLAPALHEKTAELVMQLMAE